MRLFYAPMVWAFLALSFNQAKLEAEILLVPCNGQFASANPQAQAQAPKDQTI